ncbi:xanthine dehydrogenase [Methylocapsa acidiphila]|uniref:xanthine dehydrogenase n=1 Tax=Methylocapsa acidiphila TaxID=133552 RepID=UPI000400F034|nr:xanthine dehydrogenase [Methylocapsa acidiphila]
MEKVRIEHTAQGRSGFEGAGLSKSRLAVVLGTNEIASAVAVFLSRAGRAVALTHDPLAPVIRRRMAFHDALYDDGPLIEAIAAARIESASELFDIASCEDRVAVTTLGLTELLVLGPLDVIVDARMHKRGVMPRLRGLARVTIGLGPGFTARGNCDIAVETRPGRAGVVLREGTTEPQGPSPSLLGGVGAERFVYTEAAGRWRTALDIGARVFKGVVVGHLDGAPVAAPIDGMLRGLARDGAEMPAGVKLVEVDPRGRAARCAGIDDRARAIAEATVRAVMFCESERMLREPRLSLFID